MAINFASARMRTWLAALALFIAPWAGIPAFAQEDPPGRVGRLSELQGEVSWYDEEQGQWVDAERNRPLTSGDRLSTGARTSAELRVGSTVVRLSEGTELELTRIDDERIVLHLHRGSLALNVRARQKAAEIELNTAEASLRPLRSGLYRLDRIDDSTYATALRGGLRVDDRDGFTVETGQRVELWREGSGRGPLRSQWLAPAQDGFAAWIASEDRREERSASARYVSPEMTGAEDLDRHGRWEQHPEFGSVWMPIGVPDDWAPYRYGRWAWIQPWGWTWVDDAPWGFAPFHYGRWVSWRNRWAWYPGDYVARPVYAPALVAWVGGPNFSVNINLGGPAVAWVPLAPREIYRPWYRSSKRHEERVNYHKPRPGERRPPAQVPTGPIMYGNQGVPGGVTAVPRDVLVQRQPVGRAAIEDRSRQRPVGPLSPLAPPVREAVAPQQPRERRPLPEPGSSPRERGDRGDRNERGERDDRERNRDRDRDGVVDLRQQRPPVPQPQQQHQPQPQQHQPPQPPRAVIAVPERRERTSEPDQPRTPGERQRGTPQDVLVRPTPLPQPPQPVAQPQRPAAPPVVVQPQRAPAPAAAPAPPVRVQPEDGERKRGEQERRGNPREREYLQ